MKTTPFRRALALFLSVQPVFWMSQVALAQSLEEQAREQQAARQSATRPSWYDAAQPSEAGQATAAGEPLAGSDLEDRPAERAAPPSAAAGPVPLDEPLDPDRYICGPGDVLELNFWGVRNFKLRAAIDLEGRAFVPKVGYLPLRGKTLSEARRILLDSVAKNYPGLGFGVTLAQPRTFMVQVAGAVARPGSYPARAIERVATLLRRAGGIEKTGSKRRIELRRLGGQVVAVDLLRYTLTGDVKYNPHLLDGDVVQVPFEELAATIGGAVNRPGRYELVGTRDLGELVEMAGGLTPAATPALPMVIERRREDDQVAERLLDFGTDGRPPSFPLLREDVVTVPGFRDLQRSITVVGAIAGVAAPDDPAGVKRLQFAEGASVRTVLDRVGGTGPLADLGGAYLVRKGETLPVDLLALVVMRDLKADRRVELGDTLVVPFRRRNITVEGAVLRPGSYQYNPSFGVEQYVQLAGGLSRNALALDDTYLVTPQGERKAYAAGLKLEPGYSMVVPERSWTRAEVVSIVLSAAGILLAGATLVITARK
jgi:protein involved in polysaccharide export with SLBB domain